MRLLKDASFRRGLLALPICFAVPARSGWAQQSGAGARVSGVVFDSIAEAPLVGAFVQLASAADPAGGIRTATADAKGRYEIDSIAPGRYLVAFHHPVLDSFGLQEPTYAIEIRDAHPLRLDLAVPSPGRIIAAYCGPQNPGDSLGVLVGTLLDARKLGVLGGGTVIARWAEVTFDRSGLHQDVRQIAGHSNETGWFVTCGVPMGSDVDVYAAHDADTSGVVAVHVPLAGIAHRDLYVGASERVVFRSADSASGDSAATGGALPRTTYASRGPARITGTVLTDKGIPISGARVSVVGSHLVASTNERGAFILAGVPEGTQKLATRALGYFPDERAIDILEQETTPLEVRLATTRSVLDTIRIAGKRVLNVQTAEFARRQRMGIGSFFDEQAIARIHPLETTDLLQRTASMHIVPSGSGYMLRTRGQTCLPTLYLNGSPIELLDDLKEIDMFVRPEEIQAIEMYTAGEAPMEYAPRSGCASIVVWTRP